MQAACHGDNDKGKEVATADNMDPSHPFISLENFNLENLREWDLRSESVAKSIPNDIIVPDPTPQVVRKKIPRGWDPEYTRRMFFPHWRSVLGARCLVKVYPSYAPAPVSEVDPEVLHHSWSGSMGNGSTRNPNPNLELLGRTQQPASNHQLRRPFGTFAFWGNGSSRNPSHNLLLERIRQPTSNHQSRRLFGTAAFTLLRLLKGA